MVFYLYIKFTTRQQNILGVGKHQSSCSDYLTGFPLSYSPIRGFVYKSFVNFNLQFVRVGGRLLRAICLSKLQYCGSILQCCSQENIRFDCKYENNFKLSFKGRNYRFSTLVIENKATYYAPIIGHPWGPVWNLEGLHLDCKQSLYFPGESSQLILSLFICIQYYN